MPLRGNLAIPRKIVLPLRGRARKTRAVISIAQLFGKSDRFFELLNDSARSAHESIEALARMLEQSDGAVSLAELAVARRAEKRTAEIIGEELVKVFVTALEREDIEALSGALYRIPKTVEKFGERFDLVRHLVRGEQFSSQMALAKEAAAVVVRMVAMLGKSPKLEEIKAANDTIQELESRADQLVLGNLRDIYSGTMDPITAMATRDLFDLLEKVIDRCRDVGKIVAYIVLKNS
jgi:uncharacterized protein Yka (UPF0111/DUF47 family)